MEGSPYLSGARASHPGVNHVCGRSGCQTAARHQLCRPLLPRGRHGKLTISWLTSRWPISARALAGAMMVDEAMPHVLSIVGVSGTAISSGDYLGCACWGQLDENQFISWLRAHTNF